MRKFIYFITVLFLFPCFLMGCQTQAADTKKGVEVRKASSSSSSAYFPAHREEGRQVVSDVLEAYRNFFPIRFDALVSKKYEPDRLEFVTRIEQGSIDKKILDIDFSVNRSIIKKDRLAVNFTWHRTFLAKGSGTQTKDTGTTDFVFTREADSWRLIRMSGADVF